MSIIEKNVIKVGTRSSQLARIQTEITLELLKRLNPNLNFEVIEMSTIGDKILNTPLFKVGDKGLFTKELEIALKNSEVDFVVHSLKDVSTTMPDGLVLACVFNRSCTDDVVVMSPANRGLQLKNLPPNSVIGTSSVRRVASLSRKYPHLKFLSIRGNLNTRLKKLDSGDFDAIILAKAGLDRMGLSERIDQVLEDMYYAVGQGALCCQCCKDNTVIMELLAQLNDESALLSSIAERVLMNTLDGGCSTPIGVRCTIVSENFPASQSLMITGAVFSLDGMKCVEDVLSIQLSSTSDENIKIKDSTFIEPVQDEIAQFMDPEFVYVGISLRSCSNNDFRSRLARAYYLGMNLAKLLLKSGAKDILSHIKSSL